MPLSLPLCTDQGQEVDSAHEEIFPRQGQETPGGKTLHRSAQLGQQNNEENNHLDFGLIQTQYV